MKVKKEKIIVVSSNHKIKDETDIYKELFEAGADYLHVRKYGYPTRKIVSMVERIPEEYHSRIILHSHFNVAKKYKLGGIHIPRKVRKDFIFMKLLLGSYKKNGKYIISTSYHSTRKIERAHSFYTYFFMNNFFGSIHSKGKHAYKDPDKLEDFLKDTVKDIVPLGGIDANNIRYIKEIGFTSVAIHGALWGFNNPVERFVKIKANWDNA